MSLPSQHLSDEAVVAYADGALRPVARDRARRHLDECADCARAVAVQREAVFMLRGAALPTLPNALRDRLRALPTTTDLPPTAVPEVAVGLDPSGVPVFTAYGGPGFGPPAQPVDHHRPPFALFTAAALFVAAGVGLAGLTTSQATAVPVAPARVVPSGYSTADGVSHTPVDVGATVAVWSVR